jgi:hypothetical protein
MRELTSPEAHRLLQEQAVGRVVLYEGGKTFVVPVMLLAGASGVLVLLRPGFRLHQLDASSRVRLETERRTGLNSWHSLVAWGTLEGLGDEEVAGACESWRARARSPLLGTRRPEAADSSNTASAQPGTIGYRLRMGVLRAFARGPGIAEGALAPRHHDRHGSGSGPGRIDPVGRPSWTPTVPAQLFPSPSSLVAVPD